MKFSTILITVCCLVLSVACNNNKQNESSKTKSSETIRTINEFKALADQGDAEAVKWFRKAAEQGLAEAKMKLNDMGVNW